jgi:sulfane dehydrogenase subunit SoxC
MSRVRFVTCDDQVLEGRAWTGQGPVVSVEISVDGGATWANAALDACDYGQPWAWRHWTYHWQPDRLGAHEIVIRATDATGDTQPLEQRWNLQGKTNNMAQRLTVVVREEG